MDSKIAEIKDDKNFIGKQFEKRFHYELDEYYKDTFTLKDRREQLIEMYQASQDRPQSFKSAILLEILENGMKLDIYDKDYFMLYLEHPLKRWHINKSKVTKDCQDFVWNGYLQNIQLRQGGMMSSSLEGKMYKKYLEHFYNERQHLKDFEEYFTPKFLGALVEEFSFLAGNQIQHDKVDFEKYDKMASQVIIELLPSNKEVFKPDEKVEIVAELKNVPKMHIKIFEFNSLNYYKKNCVPFKTDVNLDGLIASYENDIDFDNVSTQIKFRHTFEFPELDQKAGLFVIEFISNGYSSRAVIKKGTLSVIYKQTVTGQVAYILDDNRDICWAEDTGLYYRNEFFKADQDKNGKIIIPYEKYQTYGNAILVHNEFAQLVEFTRYSENFTLEVGYILNPESLIMSNQATVLLRPVLKVNGRKCSWESLTKVKATITTVSFVDKIPLSKTFEDLKLSNSTDLELTFSVPANLESVHIEFEATLFNISQQKQETLTSSHHVNLKTNNNRLCFYEAHLQKIEDEYIFILLGKNGEPISNIEVNFMMEHFVYLKSSKNISLTTDENGWIMLGSLDGIKNVQSIIYSKSEALKNNWNLYSTDQQYTIPESIQILEDEEIEIPFLKAINQTKFSQDSFSLIRLTSKDKYISNEFKKAKLVPGKDGSPSLISVSGLEQGFYKISFKEVGVKIRVTVHQGRYWSDDSFILNHNTLREFKINKKVAHIRIK